MGAFPVMVEHGHSCCCDTVPCLPYTSYTNKRALCAGKQLFAEALAAGTLEGFFKLIEQFRTQDEPAFCGLASLAMALNALAGPPADLQLCDASRQGNSATAQ